MKPDDFVIVSNVRKDYGDITELTHSIAMTGVQVPILYYRMDDLNVVKDGHRSLIAARIINLACEVGADSPSIHGAIKEAGYLDNASIQLVGLKDIILRGPVTDIPAIEVDPPREDGDVALFQLIASRDGLRKPLNPMEEAQAISILLRSRSGAKVAEAIGKSEPYVSRRHRLVNLHPDFQVAVASGELDPRAGEQLLVLKDDSNPELRRSLIAAKTVRSIKAKVIAANAIGGVSQGEGEELEIDPLMIALREEVKLKASMAVNALNELRVVYEEVDQKPPLDKVKEAIGWI